MNRRSFFSGTIGAAITGALAALVANKTVTKKSTMFWRMGRSFRVEELAQHTHDFQGCIYNAHDDIRSFVVMKRDFPYYDKLA